jgi:hypothetical protein
MPLISAFSAVNNFRLPVSPPVCKLSSPRGGKVARHPFSGRPPDPNLIFGHLWSSLVICPVAGRVAGCEIH